MIQDFLKEFVFELNKKVERLFRYSYLASPFKKLHRLETNLLELDSLGRIDSFAKNKSLFIDSPKVHNNLLRSEKREDGQARSNAEIIEKSSLMRCNSLVAYF